MIRFISAAETLGLRSLVLRDELAPEQCLLDQDMEHTTFHLGYFSENQELVSILTCQKENHGKLSGDCYRLRGMATHPAHLRKGYGKLLMQAAAAHIQTALQGRYLWFNAREIAFPFYEALGYEFMSDSFEIPGIGTHKEMFKLL